MDWRNWNLPMDAGRGDAIIGTTEDGRPIYRSQLGTQYWQAPRAPKPKPEVASLLPAYGGQYETSKTAPAWAGSQPGLGDLGGVLGGVLGAVMSGVSAPGRALRGQPVTKGDVINAALDWGLLSAPMSAPRGALRAGGMVDDAPKGIKAYHGSPHDFDQFDMSKIGTGEGAQAYGHGLYFAENEGVARNYRDNLSGQQFGTPLVSQDVRGWLESAGGDYQKAATEAKAFLSEYGGQMGRDEEKTLREAIALMDKGKQSWGRMYEVDINANPEDFLDWDAPLSAQPQKVRDWFDSRGITPGFAGNQSGAELLQAEKGVLGAEGTTSALREVGVPGIKYLDHGSRFNSTDGATNTRNYVVFDENLINIVKKYGVAGAATMLGVSQAEVAQAMEGQQ